jgi:hypothetical protein
MTQEGRYVASARTLLLPVEACIDWQPAEGACGRYGIGMALAVAATYFFGVRGIHSRRTLAGYSAAW